MGGGFKGFEKGLALAGGDVELAGRAFGDVGLDYVLNFFAEWLDCDCAMVSLSYGEGVEDLQG